MTEPTCTLRLGRYQDVLGDVECDALITDAPYSARTHGGHDLGAASVNRRSAVNALGITVRRDLNYAAFSPDDVREFVVSWAPRTRGWFVSITDSELAPVWAEELRSSGRYVFSPLAFVAPGSRVRLNGDGPSQWSCWIVVARPRSLKAWGTLPGAYVLPSGQNDRRSACTKGPTDVAGGKPLWLMQALVRDYSRPGDLVCDPCAGAATTLLASVIEGRRAVGAEALPEHFDKAQKRLARGYTPTLFG